MNPKKYFYLLLVSLFALSVSAQENADSLQVRTLTVRVKQDWQIPPVIELNGNQSIEIRFDYPDLNVHNFYYSVTHCNADWTPSNLSESEYIGGFNNQPLEDRKTSFNTFADYTHYRLELPNDNLQLRLSGNYQVRIYDNSDPDKTVATARFSVFERLVNIGANISSITDIDYNRAHQQLDLTVDTRNFPIRSPQMEMKVFVNQNSRTDNEVQLNVPTITQGNTLLFSHVRQLIFEAGNEFRRFEMVSYRYNGLGVERIRHIEPYYNVFLFRDRVKPATSYLFDQDQNGRFYIRNSEVQDYNNESDYFLTHFSLAADAPLGNGKLYLLGEFSHFNIDPAWELTYDIAQRAYAKNVLLKQGAYNYQYIFVPDGSTKGTTALTEGNFYEAENEYTLRVYYRPNGGRYDRLVGYNWLKSGK